MSGQQQNAGHMIYYESQVKSNNFTLNRFSEMPHYHPSISTRIDSPNAKNKSNSINHCFTNYFKSCDIDVKFK